MNMIMNSKEACLLLGKNANHSGFKFVLTIELSPLTTSENTLSV